MEQKKQGEAEQQRERELLQGRMRSITRKIMVLSGKGGVGKSTVAVNLAVSLSLAGRRVGLLDVDLHGPSVPWLLHLGRDAVRAEAGKIIPAEVGTIKVFSVGFLLKDDDEAVIWRGPLKNNVIRQFLRDIDWGELDALVIDCPPGTGDEPLSVAQILAEATGSGGSGTCAVIVTTPQDLSLIDVRKAITFCRQLSIPVLGVIENMSGFVCPQCGKVTEIFGHGGGERMAKSMGVPFLGRIPIDPAIVTAGDEGTVFMHQHPPTPTTDALSRIMQPILAACDSNPFDSGTVETTSKENSPMRVAIPLAEGRLAMHFGHCESFALMDLDVQTKRILGKDVVKAPDHEPGLLPVWLHEQGASLIIAGGMGRRAQDLFVAKKIGVIVGAPSDTPEAIADAYLQGRLQSGSNICDH